MNKHMNRRLFLKLFSATSALTLVACRTIRLPFTPEELAVKPEPYFVEPKRKPWHKLPLALDAHVHIFNASDLQTAGYWSGPIANELGWVLRELAIAMTPLVALAAAFAPDAKREIRRLNSLLISKSKDKSFTSEGNNFADPQSLVRQAADEDLDKTAIFMNENLGEGFWEEYKRILTNFNRSQAIKIEDKNDLFSENKFTQEFRNKITPRPNSTDKSSASEPISRSFAASKFEGRLGLIRSIIAHDNDNASLYATDKRSIPEVIGDHPDGMIAFVGNMLNFRYINLLKYRAAYNFDENSFGIDACFASMVDFNHWLGYFEDTCTRLEDQIVLMDRIAVMFNGAVIPIVAYNPWPDVQRHEESINLVKKAIGQHGFAGVKIYPSIGYKPYDNTEGQYANRDRKPEDVDRLNRNLEEFFDLCRDLDVPVMAHSGNDLEQYKGYREFNGPVSWGKYFGDNNGENHKTRLHLGHFGGNLEWIDGFSDMMQNNPLADYIYGDLGIWDFSSKNMSLIRRLSVNVKKPLGNGEQVIDRIMYGSDWFMLSQNKDWPTYPHRLYNALKSKHFKPTNKNKHVGEEPEYIHKIFYKNVLKLYDLDTKSATGNYGRLFTYYDKHKITPVWWDRLNKIIS